MKYSLLLWSIQLSVISFGQQVLSGKIIYKETIKLNIDIGEERPEISKMFPSSQSVDKVLIFNSNESLFKNNEKPKDLDIQHEEDGGTFQIVMKIPESIIYINKEDGVFLQAQDLMGKDFLISDKPKKYKWKVTGEQKTILEYPCQRAVLNDTSQHVVAWFSSQIPVGTGPGGMTGLPGLILALEYDEGERMSTATSIEAFPDGFKFTKPDKGKKVSRAEYDKIREQKMKEMGAVNGKGNGVKMIIREERH
ncbi:MAG: GLPGLI family protein [Saprospiraceae bacterium]|nr:GLPGLI family protein [Saprospiraceae bacterium]